MGSKQHLMGVLLASAMVTGAACQTTQRWSDSIADLDLADALSVTEQQTCSPVTMKGLAQGLDALECHINRYGSITPKSPDVWGQARFTQFREEFEKEMAAELDNFSYVISGNQSRSDQSFLTSASALSAAIQAPSPTTTPQLIPTTQTQTQLSKDPTTGDVTLTKTTSALPSKSPPLQPLDTGDPESFSSSPDKVINRNDATISQLGFRGAGGAISIEPTEFLAQKERYLNYLNQIRRENEGDDTADSPGYSLNLLRLPVSVLPGKQTDVGYAAEITVTLNPVLGNELLPMTYRNLITNDLLNQLGLPLAQALETAVLQYPSNPAMAEDFETFYEIFERIGDYKLLSDTDPWSMNRYVGYINYLNSPQAKGERTNIDKITKADPDLKKIVQNWGYVFDQPFDEPHDQKSPPSGSTATASSVSPSSVTASDAKSALQTAFVHSVNNLSFANGLDNRTAFPTTDMEYIHGERIIYHLVYSGYQAFSSSIQKRKYAHLPDIRSYLREQTLSAYEFLKKNPELWECFCTQELADAIRSNRYEEVGLHRVRFRKQVAIITGDQTADIEFDPHQVGKMPPAQYNLSTTLSWCLIVDAAMFNDRLIRDMQETSASKGQQLPGCEAWRPYFLPDPPADCRQLFRDYVQLRWPIRVFALDPYNQEENITDSLSTRREMQLALSLAFTTGKINARNFTRYVRRLEANYETVALNRTQVGFSSGENVFGWRFYPRFQTPDTPSNLQDLFQNQLIGGPRMNMLLRQRRLEPGIRECVAIVMMPSFVPYTTMDTVSNWFPITNPQHRVLNNTESLKLSRMTQSILTCKLEVNDACRYLENDHRQLNNRLEQLKARLPFQTITSSVPTLGNLGGFEMFSNGVSDLAPQLFGWYGAPGIDPTADTTTLFLVGEHFSPLHTQVIVGNQAIPKGGQQMISRQVMKVTFPKGAYTVTLKKEEHGGVTGEVHIHLATPYGVTPELAVPVAKVTPTKETPTGFTFGTNKLTVRYGRVAALAHAQSSTSEFIPTPKGAEENDLRITWNAPTTSLTAQVKLEFEFAFNKTTLRVPCQGMVIGIVQDKAATASDSGSSTGASSGSTSKTPTPKPDLKEIVIPKSSLDLIANELIQQIAALGPQSDAKNDLAKAIKSTKVTITPLTPFGYVSQSATTSDQLSVSFKEEGACPMAEPLPVPMGQELCPPPIQHLDPVPPQNPKPAVAVPPSPVPINELPKSDLKEKADVKESDLSQQSPLEFKRPVINSSATSRTGR